MATSGIYHFIHANKFSEWGILKETIASTPLIQSDETRNKTSERRLVNPNARPCHAMP